MEIDEDLIFLLPKFLSEKKNLVFGLQGGLQSKLRNNSNSLQSHWNTLV